MGLFRSKIYLFKCVNYVTRCTYKHHLTFAVNRLWFNLIYQLYSYIFPHSFIYITWLEFWIMSKMKPWTMKKFHHKRVPHSRVIQTYLKISTMFLKRLAGWATLNEKTLCYMAKSEEKSVLFLFPILFHSPSSSLPLPQS